jgi:hypothetical protein
MNSELGRSMKRHSLADAAAPGDLTTRINNAPLSLRRAGHCTMAVRLLPEPLLSRRLTS